MHSSAYCFLLLSFIAHKTGFWQLWSPSGCSTRRVPVAVNLILIKEAYISEGLKPSVDLFATESMWSILSLEACIPWQVVLQRKCKIALIRVILMAKSAVTIKSLPMQIKTNSKRRFSILISNYFTPNLVRFPN